MKLACKSVIYALAILSLASCHTSKKVPYTVEAELIPAEKLSELNTIADPVISPGDLLNIDVTSTDMASVVPFNKGLYVKEDGTIQRISVANLQAQNYDVSTDYYLVNADGQIDFPGIGFIEVGGLTKQQLAEKIASYIYPRYTKERPKVDVRLMNFKVVVTGAVKTPGVYSSKNERLNLLEALAMAGDLDIKGDRENILLYRTNSDGTREVHKLDINDRNILLSPYFALQQNDIIYVTPNKSMQQNAWQLNPLVTATFTYVGGLASLLSLVIGIINLAQK